MKGKSPAKVNLFFRVLSKRSDGYHEIFTLMCKVPHLADLISVELSERDFLTCNGPPFFSMRRKIFDEIQNPSSQRMFAKHFQEEGFCRSRKEPYHRGKEGAIAGITCSNPQIPTDKTNLALKALNLFRQETGLIFSANIHLEKEIPIEAGLGGGSSNAATVLTLLNELHGNPLTKQDLMALGAKLGSDVPFFFSEHAAVVSGMGEKVEEITLPHLGQIKIFKPDYGLSTKEIYANTTPQTLPDPEQLLQSFLKGTPIFHNDLENAAYKLRPELFSFRKKLDEQYTCTSMTGSGTAHFVFT